jgi:hypothetical protein
LHLLGGPREREAEFADGFYRVHGAAKRRKKELGFQ